MGNRHMIYDVELNKHITRTIQIFYVLIRKNEDPINVKYHASSRYSQV